MAKKIKKYRYPGIRSFSKEEEKIFFGRTSDTDNIYASIHLNGVTTVFGQSGIGKTSVINAGVISKFEKYNEESKSNAFSIIKVETGNYIPSNDGVRKEKKLIEIIAEKCFKGAKEFCKLPAFISDDMEQNLWLQFKLHQPKNASAILIFDQAEQLFTFPSEEFNVFLQNVKSLTSKYLPDEIRAIVEDADDDALSEEEYNNLFTPLDIKIVFVIRSDKLQLLSRLKNIIPGILQNCYEILPFNFKKAKEAIVEPSQFDGSKEYTPPFEFTPEAIDKILAVLSSKKTTLDNPDDAVIEPYYLQIICQHIEREIVKDAKNKKIFPEDLPADLTDIVGKYYLRCIDSLQLDDEEKNKVQDFIELKMIYEPDNRRITLDKAMIISDKQNSLTEPILNKLVEERLLKAERNISGGVLYELTHDCLVEPVLAIKRKRLDEYNRMKQQGDLLLNQLKYEEALEVYTNCLNNFSRINAGDTEVLKARGNVYYLLKKYKESNEDYIDAIRFDAQDSNALYYIALNYYYLNDDESAEIYFDKAAQSNKLYAADIYNEAGVLYYNSNLYALAESYYNKALKANTDYFLGYYNLGLLYRKEKNFEKAIAKLNIALSLNKESADALNELGNLYLNQQDFEKAQLNYEKATAIDPKHYYAWFNMGDIEYYDKKNLDIALNFYTKALEAYPEYEDAYLRQASIYLTQVKYNEAIERLEKLIQINPKSAQAYALLGISYSDTKDYDNALKNLNIAISLNATHEGYYYLGYTYHQSDNLAESEKNYQKALELNDKYIPAIEELAGVFNELKKYVESINLLENKIEKEINSPRIYYLLAEAYYYYPDFNKAKENFSKVVETIFDTSSYLHLAEIEKQSGSTEKALEYYNKIIENDPVNTFAYEYAGRLLYDKDKFNEALTYFKKLADLMPQSADAFNLMGNCYYEMNEYANAKSIYYKAVELNPAFYHSIYNLGLTAQNMTMPEEAANYFKKTIELNADYVPAYQKLSEVFIQLNQPGDAIELLNTLAAKQPSALNYAAVGNAYVDYKKDYIKAKEYAMLAVETDGKSDAGYTLAGIADYNLEKKEDAYKDFFKAVECNPQNAYAYNAIGLIKIDEGNYEDALGYFETAIKLDPDFTDAYNNLGHCYFNMNPNKKAEELFQKSINADPKNDIAYCNLAEAQVKLEKYNEAITNANAAIKLNPDLSDAYLVAGAAYEKLDKNEEAITCYKKCLELSPGNQKATEQLAALEQMQHSVTT